MNNDMAGKLNTHIEMRKINGIDSNAIQKRAAQKSIVSDITLSADTFAQTGCAFKNIPDSIVKSTQEFLNNPEMAESYIDFCDGLVQEGVCLREAVEKTDKVFELLRSEEIYK